MKCWCGHELTWGGDHSEQNDEWLYESNYHCSECGRSVYVYHPHPQPQNDSQTR